MKRNSNKTKDAEVKHKTSLEIFIDSLDGDEKKLLSKYLESQSYESLSDSFDKILDGKEL